MPKSIIVPRSLLLGRWLRPAPLLLDHSRALLFRQAACLSRRRWPGGDTALGHVQGALEQEREAFDDFIAVTMLAARRLGGQVQDTARIDVRLQLAEHAGALRLIQTGGAQDIEGQLDLRGRAIDMLSPWAAATTELKLQFRGWYCYGLGNLDVGVWWHDSTPISTPSLIFLLGHLDTALIFSLSNSRNQPLVQHLPARCQALLHGLDDERPGNRGVAGYLGKATAFAGGDEFAPRYALGIGTARESTPVHRLRTDAHAIGEALKTAALANTLINQFKVGPHLLSPVARHTTANSEDTNGFLRPHTLGIVFQVKKWVVGKRGLPGKPTPPVGEGKI